MSIKVIQHGAIAALFLLFNSVVTAQEMADHIQVVGEAEMEVVPDQIFVMVHMVERFDGRDKYSIEDQEQALMKALKEGGLDPESFELSGSRASYVKIPWKTRKDVMATADYEILVANAEEAALIFEAVDSLQIQSCYISQIDHSQRSELERDVRINAMKEAGNRATYMLEAVGQKRGKLMHVIEQQHQVMHQHQQFLAYERADYEVASKKLEKFHVSFKKIKLRCVVSAKFGIE